MSSYLQSTATECGLACIAYIANYHGQSYEMSELRAKFAISIRGTNLAEIVRLASLMGLQARPLRLELDELSQLTKPCILHWNLNHFVVLTKIRNGKVTLHDPAAGEITMVLAEVSRHFTGVALELTPALEFEQIKPKPRVGWRQLVGKIVGLRRSLSQLFLLATSLQAVLLVTPMFTQWVVDNAIVSGDIDLLWVLIIGFILVTLIRVSLESVRSWLVIVASAQFGTQWGARVMGHLLRLPMQWYEVRHIGDVVSRFQSVQSIQQAVSTRLVEIMLDGLFGLVTLIVMLLYSVKLTLVVVLAVFAYAAIRISPHGAFHRASDEALTHEANAQSHFLESLRAIQTIKLAGLEDQRNVRWLNLVVLATNRRINTQRMTIAFGAGYSLVFGLESIAILGWGATMVINSALTVGMLMAFVAYKDEFSSRMQRFIDNSMAMRMLRLHVERLSDIVLADKEKTTGILIPDQFNPTHSAESAPTIKLENVSFRYGDSSHWILRNINIEIKANEHVAIVGATGCGKTTLAKLILGLLEPTEGVITVGGATLQQVGLSNWRKQVGAVMQDDQLFSASIQDNISAFDEKVDFERVSKAASLAAVHSEILTMPMGYHTLNGDMGSSLSGGQKQRILLARALYRQPKVLVLDEATSHLDVGREKEVNQSICNLAITRITIAHRPETIAMAERVINLQTLS